MCAAPAAAGSLEAPLEGTNLCCISEGIEREALLSCLVVSFVQAVAVGTGQRRMAHQL